MSSAPRILRIAAAVSLAAVAACQETPPTGPPRVPNLERGVQQPDVPDPEALARTVPGFGGLFLDQSGRPTVYLTDVAGRRAAEVALGRFLEARGQTGEDLRVLRADYGWRELSRWFSQATREVLAIEGAVLVDLDERTNRVVIGVESAGLEGAARAAAATAAVPAAAVEVRVVPPIVFASTLRDLVRPTQGGLQVHFFRFLCTLGFNAVHAAGNSFITNSHCTQRQGRFDGVAYYQPLSSVAESFIGNEADDPSYFRGGDCPRGRKCRYADAARVAYAEGVSFALGQIAQTAGPNTGDLNIVGGFTITSEASGASFLVGEIANKVGRTGGWTQGEITNTCVNTAVFASNIALLCQTFVAAGVQSGDSGSPVFIQTGGDNVRLAGILWGGDSAGTVFVFSPLASIEQELGALTTF